MRSLMKPSMRARLLTLAAVLVLTLSLAGRVQGQEDGPPVPTNEYGTPDMSLIELTPTSHYKDCLYCVDIPGLGETGLALSYDLYADNYGNTWVVPSPFTLIYTAIFPEDVPPGLAGRTDGWSYGSLAMGIVDVLGGFEALGIDVGGVDLRGIGEDGVWDAIRDVIDMEGDHLSFMLQLGLALADADENGLPLELWQLSWIYGDNPFDPTDDPTPPSTGTPQATGTPRPTATLRPSPTPMPTATPMPTPIQCPPASISQRPPSALIVEAQPPNPVVVGQGGQGLDVTVRAVSYPVIHRWWTHEWTYECRWWDVATYGEPWGHQGHCCPEDNPGCARDDYYRVRAEQECVEHVERIPDPILIEYLVGTANLRPGSIAWIENDLAQKYPGARVHRPNWSVVAQGSVVYTADWRCIAEAIAHFGFEDPGYYDLAVHGQTAGTIYTPPRSFGYADPTPQPVYLMDTVLLH